MTKIAVAIILCFSSLDAHSLPQGDRDNSCPSYCPFVYRQVCGTDGKTYDNACLMEVESCMRKTHIEVQKFGSCSSTTIRTDEGKEEADLVPGEITELEYIAAASRCVVGCHRIYLPVCGTDGNTYDNACILKETACIKDIEVNVQFEGYCEGKELTEQDYQRCRRFSCTKIERPVCGSDGKTYSNACMLELNACLRVKTSLRIRHRGSCSPGSLPDDATTTEAKRPQKIIDTERDAAIFVYKREAGDPFLLLGGPLGEPLLPVYQHPLQHLGLGRQSRQRCPTGCSFVYRPVCGTDGITYPSECQLRLAQCDEEGPTGLGLSYRGACSEDVADGGDSLGDFPLLPVVAETERFCPAFCTLEWMPLCGKDGVTYPNRCNLQTAECVKSRDIEVEHNGECKRKKEESTEEEDFAADHGERGNCGIGVTCEPSSAPVCGTDNVTYSNRCNLEATANSLNIDIKVQHGGRCKPVTAEK